MIRLWHGDGVSTPRGRHNLIHSGHAKPAHSDRRKDEGIWIEQYDERWPALFEREASLIRHVIGSWITGGCITSAVRRFRVFQASQR